MALMAQFYHHLRSAPTKAEALRRAQIAMLRGEVYTKDNRLFGPGFENGIQLSEEVAGMEQQVFSHPYDWAMFTLVGSPW